MPRERDIRGRTQFAKLRHARMLKYRDAIRLMSNLSRTPYIWTRMEGRQLLDDLQQHLDMCKEDFEMAPNMSRDKLPSGTAHIKLARD